MQKAPLIFQPYYKTAIWGGTAIADFKGESLPYGDIGESWELSAMPGRESVVSQGLYEGRSLSRLVAEFGDLLLGKGLTEKYGGTFPLLMKFIHARENLSVQVHPADDLALERHNSPGKTEMWYIISAAPGAKIYSGLRREITPGEYVRHIEEGTFFDLVASYESAPGDAYYLPSGQVHAIGAGNLLAEIQQPSDITYRIFDYKRTDAEGRERTLHTELALNAIDLRGDARSRLPLPEEADGEAILLQCPYFDVRRLKLSGTRELSPTGEKMLAAMCVDGSLAIACEEGSAELTAGHTALIPAVCGNATLTGKATLLLVAPN